MMLRAFDDPDVTHVEGDVDPVRDMQIITQELVLKDLSIVKNEVESKRKNVDRGVGGKDAKMEFQSLEKIVACLEEGKPVRFGSWSPLDIEVLNKRQLNTAKEVVYLINLSAKDFLRKKNKWLPKIAEAVTASGGGVTIPFSVEHEQSLLDMELAGTLDEFLEALGDEAQALSLPQARSTSSSRRTRRRSRSCRASSSRATRRCG